MEVLSSTFSSDKYVDCAVDLGDGKPPRTCPAFVGDLDRISEVTDDAHGDEIRRVDSSDDLRRVHPGQGDAESAS